MKSILDEDKVQDGEDYTEYCYYLVTRTPKAWRSKEEHWIENYEYNKLHDNEQHEDWDNYYEQVGIRKRSITKYITSTDPPTNLL